MRRPIRRKGRTAVTLACGLLVGVLITVASTAAVRTIVSQPVVAESAGTITAVTSSGALQPRESLRLTATWSKERSLLNQSQGVVTSVELQRGTLVKSGQVIYHVNEKPVAVLSGSVPSYRTLAYGAEGKDAEQLQRFLRSRHLYAGVIDGRLGSASIRALATWKKSIGLPGNGSLAASEASFIPNLPREVILDGKNIIVGNTVTSGQVIGFLRTRAPTYTAQLDGQPSSPVKAGLPISYRMGEVAGRGKITAITTTSEGVTQLTVRSLSLTNDSSGCTVACVLGGDSVKAVYPGEVELTPEVSGTIVPVAAITTNNDSQTVVLTTDRRSRAVVVLATADGRAVVRGIPPGVRVLITAG